MYRLFYPVLRSWRTYAIDKTIAPTPSCHIFRQSRQSISIGCRCYCQPYLHRIIKPPSLRTEDKIYNNTFLLKVQGLHATLSWAGGYGKPHPCHESLTTNRKRVITSSRVET